jgi:formate dehydrogenase alpha subunit
VAVAVPAGASIHDAVRAAGREVPTLCHDERVGGGGSCRVCLVAVEGAPGPVASCVAPAVEGAAITTDDPGARAAARGVLELLVSELPPRALEPPTADSRLAAACRALGVDGGAFAGARHERGRDDSHPYIKLDRDLCIACGLCVRLCDELQGTFALTMQGRGFETHVAAGAGERWIDSPCVACGACADGCPTGALNEPGFLEPAPVESVTTTTCGFCGVGCTLDVHVRGGRVAAVTPSRSGPVNRGHACVKGRFAHGFAAADDRLTVPLVRRGGRLRAATWDEALAAAAGGLRRIAAAHGPAAVGVISSARATNEENYLVQKLVRVGLGTHNVDNCSRICHAPSAAGLRASLGLAGGTNPLEDLDRARCILVAGANPTEAHPVIGSRIIQRAIAGARLVVIDPRRIDLASYADVHLRPRPGTNVAVFHGLARVILEEGLADDGFLDARASGLEALRARLVEFPPERVERISGVPADELRRAARLYGARGSAIVYGLGVTEHVHGTDGVRALANLAILTGNVGTPDGGGIMPLRGQNNVQGASDVGALPEYLPGYAPVGDAAARARFEAAWGVRLPAERGLRIPEMLAAARDGGLRALWVIGEDVVQTEPDASRVEEALDRCELVVCQELFLSGTARRADVVFPAASFLEKEGTFVNFDRRFQRVRAAVPPPGEAVADFEIVHRMGRALGVDLGCPTPAAAMEELAALVPEFAGISHSRLDREGAVHWPCPSAGRPGQAVLHRDGFATPDGRARLADPPALPSGEAPDGDYPLLLSTGRRLHHYNTGSMTARTPSLELAPDERVEIHPADAGEAGVRDGDLVELASRRGAIALRARLSERVRPGEVFLAFHFPDVPANRLTSPAGDVATSCPEYKVSAVRLRRLDGPRAARGVARSDAPGRPAGEGPVPSRRPG